jgi:hypothetical protein
MLIYVQLFDQKVVQFFNQTGKSYLKILKNHLLLTKTLKSIFIYKRINPIDSLPALYIYIYIYILKVKNYSTNFISNMNQIQTHQQTRLYVQIWFRFLLNKLKLVHELFN